MASAETRDVVKQYELHYNALIKALQPGGLLAAVELKAPCEALLIPRQVSLEAAHIAALLGTKVQRPASASPKSPPPPLSALFGEGHDDASSLTPSSAGAPKAHASAGAREATAVAASPSSPSPLFVSPENAAAFSKALTTFLEYHVLHFDGYGNSEFTNFAGQRGAFSEDLDHVKRFGHIGQVAVLADADPLRPAPRDAQRHAAAGGHTISPATLQVFIIDRPLMDSEEMRFVVKALQKLAVTDPIASPKHESWSPPQPPQQANLQTPSRGNVLKPAMELPFLMSVHHSSQNPNSTAASASPPAPPPNTATRTGGVPQQLLQPQAQQEQTRHSSGVSAATAAATKQLSETLLDAQSDNESISETIIIDDFEEEPPEEPDLTPYVSKYTRISEQQRRRSSSQIGRVSDGVSAATTAGAAAVHTPPVPGALDLFSEQTHVGAGAGAGTGAGPVTAQAVTAPLSSSVSSSVNASRAESTDGHSTSSRGRVVSVTLAAPNIKAAGATTTTSTHANVLRHEYSRECIKDYRRVVAADNEIFYNEFERLMGLRCAAPLAKLMSSYVAKNQQLQQPILNNVKYNKFITSCHDLLHQVPRLSGDQERCTILKEGIERYVTSRLYRQLHSVCEDEKRQNAMLQKKLLRLENMTAQQLEALPEVERHHVWGQAMFELDGMDFFKSPREKLRCGMRACELLSLAVGDILRQRRNAAQGKKEANGAGSSGGGGTPLAFGADEFLPCFLLLVLRARPLNYVQNISYIEKFRYASLMSPEESYCLATLQSAMLFWLNCKDDGHMRSRSPSPAAAASRAGGGTATAQGRAGAAGALSQTSPSTDAVPHPHPTAPAPLMTEQDLLPSVRQASYNTRLSGDKNGSTGGYPSREGAPLSEGAPPGTAQEGAPTVLDVLFGWANRNLAPLADEIGFGSTTRRGNNNASTPTTTGTVPGMAASPPRGAVVDGLTAVPQARVANAGGVGMQAATTPSFSDAFLPKQPVTPQPDANSRALVREWLVTQNKSFEQLTLTEIQMIVEEARQMLKEKKPGAA